MAAMTLPQLTAQKITDMILEESYAAGDKLPTETELCARFETGRNTVREALKILASQNIITIRQGAGSFVSDRKGVPDDPLGFNLISDRRQLTEDLFQVLIILEPSIAAMAAENATEDDILRLEEASAALQEAKDDLQEYIRLDARFHCILAESTHNLVMNNLTPIIENGIKYYAGEFDRSDTGAHFHSTMLRLIREHRAVEAESEMRYHLLFDKHKYNKLHA